jgi:hypothetical protein
MKITTFLRRGYYIEEMGEVAPHADPFVKISYVFIRYGEPKYLGQTPFDQETGG